MGERVSKMAETLIGSEIIKLAAEINQMIAEGQKMYNFTIGDFDPSIFPIPDFLTHAIKKAYDDGYTNYPSANGMAELRKTVARLLRRKSGLDYDPDEVLISAGARPLIFSVFQTLLDPGDKIVFPAPSWNNNHYTHINRANAQVVETHDSDNFMPSAEMLEPHLKDATLLALCSPLNPTGTVFTKEKLEQICHLVIQENEQRKNGQKPLYIMYDQIYWMLTHEGITHYDPVSLCPELRDYTIFIDGMSKAFCATGVRVGWSVGPRGVIDKMRAINSHMGAWAPKPEQIGANTFLQNDAEVDKYLTEIRTKVSSRLDAFYEGIMKLKQDGYPVNAIAPQAAIYLTVQFSLVGKRTPDGQIISSPKDVTAYLLSEAHLGIVPFYAFGASADSDWFRLSIGTAHIEQIPEVMNKLKSALDRLA